MITLAVVVFLALDPPTVAHARHGERSCHLRCLLCAFEVRIASVHCVDVSLYLPELPLDRLVFDPIRGCLSILAVRSPSMSAGEHFLSIKKEGSQGTRNHGAEHSKSTHETVRVEKGLTGEAAGAAGASLGRRGGNASPAASDEKVVVVARYGPRPHPKKHN